MTEVTTGGDRPSIRDSVRDSLKNLGDRTRSAVIEHYAQREAAKQAEALIKGLDKLSEDEKTLQRIKPTFAGYDDSGAGVGAAMFSKEQTEQRKKLAESIEKTTKAINKADDGDFGDLLNLVNKG